MLSQRSSPLTVRVRPLFRTGSGSGVRSLGSKLNFLRISTKAIFASISANLKIDNALSRSRQMGN